jgi:hypothetical protein
MSSVQLNDNCSQCEKVSSRAEQASSPLMAPICRTSIVNAARCANMSLKSLAILLCLWQGSRQTNPSVR